MFTENVLYEENNTYKVKKAEDYIQVHQQLEQATANQTYWGQKEFSSSRYLIKYDRCANHPNQNLRNCVPLLEVAAGEIYLLVLEHNTVKKEFQQPKPQLLRNNANQYMAAMREVNGYRSFANLYPEIMTQTKQIRSANQENTPIIPGQNPAFLTPRSAKKRDIEIIAKFVPALIMARFLDDDDPHQENLGADGIKIDNDRAFNSLQARLGLLCGYDKDIKGNVCYCGIGICGFTNLKLSDEAREESVYKGVFEYSMLNFPKQSQFPVDYFTTLETTFSKYYPDIHQHPLILSAKFDTIFRILTIPAHFYTNIINTIVAPHKPWLADEVNRFILGRLEHLKEITTKIAGYREYFTISSPLIKNGYKTFSQSNYDINKYQLNKHLKFYFNHRHIKNKIQYLEHYNNFKQSEEKMYCFQLKELVSEIESLKNNLPLRKKKFHLINPAHPELTPAQIEIREYVLTGLIQRLLKHRSLKPYLEKTETCSSFFERWQQEGPYYYDYKTSKTVFFPQTNALHLGDTFGQLQTIMQPYKWTFIVDLPEDFRIKYKLYLGAPRLLPLRV